MSEQYFSDDSSMFSDNSSILSDASSLTDFDVDGYSSDENMFSDNFAPAMKGGDDMSDYDDDDDDDDDMSDLEELVGGFSIGGDNDNSKKDKITRNFILVEIDGVEVPPKESGDYTIATHKRDPKTGEMVQRKSPPHPGDAARKAFSAICKKPEFKNKCKQGKRIHFKIRETTRGRPKTVKEYYGEIVYFDKPKMIEFKRKDKSGKIKKIKQNFTFKPVVKRVTANKSGGFGYYYA